MQTLSRLSSVCQLCLQVRHTHKICGMYPLSTMYQHTHVCVCATILYLRTLNCNAAFFWTTDG